MDDNVGSTVTKTNESCESVKGSGAISLKNVIKV